jgi:hypothetical protein
VWRDDPLWDRFWSSLPESRWHPLGEADAPYRGRLGWSSATLGAVLTDLAHAPSTSRTVMAAIAVAALWGVWSADERAVADHQERRDLEES